MNEIEIPLSKTKLILVLVGASLFVFFGSWCAINPEKFATIRYSENIVFIAGIAAVLFFGLCIIFIMIKVFDSKPGLVVNDNGVLDNSGATSVGFIAWSDIAAITTLEIASSKIIIIHTSNPDKYIKRAGNIISKKAMKANYKRYGSPLSITVNSLKIRFSELENLLTDQIEMRRK